MRKSHDVNNEIFLSIVFIMIAVRNMPGPANLGLDDAQSQMLNIWLDLEDYSLFAT
jgi:hypothetical protein